MSRGPQFSWLLSAFLDPYPQALGVTLNSKSVLNNSPYSPILPHKASLVQWTPAWLLPQIFHIPDFFTRKLHDSHSSRVAQCAGFYPRFPETLLTPSLSETILLLPPVRARCSPRRSLSFYLEHCISRHCRCCGRNPMSTPGLTPGSTIY